MKVTLRKKKLKSGNYSLYLDIYHNGERNYEFLKLYLTKDREQNKETNLLAQKIRNKRESELQSNSYGFIPDFKKRTSFVKYFEYKIKDEGKYSNGNNTLKHLKKYSKDISFDAIKRKWVEGFKDYLLKKVSQGTANVYFSKFKSIFNDAVEDGIINNNLTKSVKNISLKDYTVTSENYFELNELLLLNGVECQSKDVKDAFIFSCFTGLRFGDVRDLTWGQIKKDYIELRQEKRGVVNRIPLSSTALTLLDKRRGVVNYLPDVKVFNLPKRSWTNRLLKRWEEKAGLKKNIHYHMSRHTFATLGLMSDVDLHTMSKLLGHKNSRTTEIYAKVVDKKKKEAVDKMPYLELT